MGTIPLVETIQWLIFGINMFIGATILFKFTSVITMVRILLLCVYSGFEGIKTYIYIYATTTLNYSLIGAWTSLWNVSLPKMIAGVTMGTGLFELFPDRLYLASVSYLFAYFFQFQFDFLGVFASVVLGVGVIAVISILESYYKPSLS
ncbi:hypothetical protein MKW92_025924 [Papaver armeniacum]|nr:hypothetical protein MKW92_025924 [Papaver armeniacum]